MLVHRDNIQSVAWLLLLASFAVFLLLVIGGPLAAREYLRSATRQQSARVEVKRGTLALQAGGEQGTLSDEEASRRVSEDWILRSGDDFASAFISFFDASVDEDLPGSTLSLDPHTQLRFRRLRRARFSTGRVPPTVELEARPTQRYAGGLQIGTTWGERRFLLDLQDIEGRAIGRVTLAPESRARIVFLDHERFRARVARGSITVTNGHGRVVLGPGERSDTGPTAAPSPPIRGTVNIVRDSDFDRLDAEGAWEFGRRGPEDPEAPPGRALAVTQPDDDQSLLRFEREGSEGVPADLFFRQSLGPLDSEEGFDVRRAIHIGVQARLRVLDQSVPGGGIEESEYPLILRLRSIDRDTTSPDGCEWTVGFYSLPPEEGRPSPIDGQQIPQGQWIEFDSGNLLDAGNRFAFGNRSAGCAVPTHLIRVEVGVSGHDYESEIDWLEVQVE